MLELRRIRTWTPEGQTEPEPYDSGFKTPIYFKNIGDIAKNYRKTINALPDNERQNLYVTCNNVDPSKSKREESWKDQPLIMWDIDDVAEDDHQKYERYIDAVANAIKVKKSAIFATSTGGGFHMVIELKKPITSKNWFDEQKINYHIHCLNINELLEKEGLSGKLDPQVFAPNRMFRLPGSISIKPGRKPKEVKFLQGAVEPLDWDIQKATGLPNLMPEKDFMSDKELSYIKVDSPEVEAGCAFLQFAKAEPNAINEPMWYGVLSIVGRLENGTEKAHEYSRGHHAYSPTKTERKLAQSIASSGPRTCDNIDSLWRNCSKCPNYKKVRSPINLKSEDFIATAHSGFHSLGPKGKLIPQYDDLRKFYDQESSYCNAADTHYRFADTHWQETPDVFIDNYAESKFVPAPKNTMCSEFRGKVKRTNLKTPEWFSENTNRLINFKNGVLNIDTMELKPHTPEFGFTSTLPFDYDPKAECPDFRKMLKNVTEGDVSKQTVLMEYLGYCISGDEPKADKILVLTGEGQNGKSRFLNVWKALGGKGVRALGVTEIMNPFYLQRLDGALFNIMEEIPSFQKKELWEMMKHLITGGNITVSKKFKDPYDFQNKAKFIMTCNQLPQGADQNHGYFRRMLIVPFDATFSDEKGNIDRDIDQRVIANEMAGVANIAIKMYHQLKRNNYRFTECKAAERSITEYRQSLDSVYRWCDEHLEIGKQFKDPAKMDCVSDTRHGRALVLEELRKEYAIWCQNMGERPVAMRAFTKRFFDFVMSHGKITLHDSTHTELEKEEICGLGRIIYGPEGDTSMDTTRTDDAPQVLKFRSRVNGVRKLCVAGLRFLDENDQDF